jgi:hypothetical protein
MPVFDSGCMAAAVCVCTTAGNSGGSFLPSWLSALHLMLFSKSYKCCSHIITIYWHLLGIRQLTNSSQQSRSNLAADCLHAASSLPLVLIFLSGRDSSSSW